MRQVSLVLALVIAPPALAATSSFDRLSTSSHILPASHFSAWEHVPDMNMATVHTAEIPAGVVGEALDTASSAPERHDLLLNALAAGWEPAQRTAFEDLRDAQRAYAAAAGGDSDARGQRFVSQLKQVVEGSGRSVASETASADSRTLNDVYDRVIRDASDIKLQRIEASETAWIAYRDAFDRFARVMDKPDGVKAVQDDLARHRAEELEAEAAQ